MATSTAACWAAACWTAWSRQASSTCLSVTLTTSVRLGAGYLGLHMLLWLLLNVLRQSSNNQHAGTTHLSRAQMGTAALQHRCHA